MRRTDVQETVLNPIFQKLVIIYHGREWCEGQSEAEGRDPGFQTNCSPAHPFKRLSSWTEPLPAPDVCHT